MIDLDALLRDAAARFRDMTPSARQAILEQQRRSFIIAEMGFGSDADEAAYRHAAENGDQVEIARLDADAEKRMQTAKMLLDRTNP